MVTATKWSRRETRVIAAENARLRWAIMGMLRWQWKFYAELHRAVPTLTVNEGIVALQVAIERREGE